RAMPLVSLLANSVSSFSILGFRSASVEPTSCPFGAARPTPKVMSWPYFGWGVPGRLASLKGVVGVRCGSVAMATIFGGVTGSAVQAMGSILDNRCGVPAALCRGYATTDRPRRQAEKRARAGGPARRLCPVLITGVGPWCYRVQCLIRRDTDDPT